MRRHLLLVLLLTGCAAPLVDQPGVNYAKDLAECQVHAEGVPGAGTGVAAGAAIGVGLGYVLCRSMGGTNCGSTARGTAVMGAAAGGSSGAQSEMSVVRACLIGRGYRVIR